jgi:hypothetical protein
MYADTDRLFGKDASEGDGQVNHSTGINVSFS